MSGSFSDGKRAIVPMIDGPLKGRTHVIDGSAEVEMLDRPHLVFDEDTLGEISDLESMADDKQYIVYRLECAYPGYEYRITDITSREGLREYEAEMVRKSYGYLLHALSLVPIPISIAFGYGALSNAGFSAVAPAFYLWFACWALSAFAGCALTAVGHAFSPAPVFSAISVFLNILVSPLGSTVLRLRR